jgi:hypothetical protein
MKLGANEIAIKGVQYETDSCYESKNKILIIEGKSASAYPETFNIRQLYFPFRAVQSACCGKKEIICIFLTNRNGVIHIWKYGFSDMKQMDSIQLQGHYMYQFSS